MNLYTQLHITNIESITAFILGITSNFIEYIVLIAQNLNRLIKK